MMSKSWSPMATDVCCGAAGSGRARVAGSSPRRMLLVRDGRIAWVGTDADAAERSPTCDEVVDLGGRLVTPGIVDAHNHVRLGTGTRRRAARGRDHHGRGPATGSTTGCEAHPGATLGARRGLRLRGAARGAPPACRATSIGAGGGRPVMLLDYSVHAALLNRPALEAFGIGEGSGDVPWGTVERDGDGASDRLRRRLRGQGHRGRRAEGAAAGVAGLLARRAVRAGGRRAADGRARTASPPWSSRRTPSTTSRCSTGPATEGARSARVVAALFHPVGTTRGRRSTRSRWPASATTTTGSGCGAVKLYIDDIVEPHTAAMHEPYANRPDTRGRTYYDPAEFADVVTELDRRGFPCFVHATGDRGISTVLDAFAAAGSATAADAGRDTRHQVVHVECTDERDLDRFAELGVVACMQPRHCAPEIVQQWRENVGEQRWRYAWPMRSLADRGATLAFSSDWNVAEMDPLDRPLHRADPRRPRRRSSRGCPRSASTSRPPCTPTPGAAPTRCTPSDDRGDLRVGQGRRPRGLLADLFERSSRPRRCSRRTST